MNFRNGTRCYDLDLFERTEIRWESVVKVGLLGAGYILAAHVEALRATPGVDAVAIFDKNKRRAEQAASRYGIGHVCGSFDELLASDVDCIHILLPPQLHEQSARRAIEAGKHVFLEKPMGLGSVECREIEAMALKKGVNLGVNHNFLYSSAWERLRNDIRSGAIGKVDHLVVNWFFPLSVLRSGPYDNWMVATPDNLVFELFPHLIAFVVDAIGPMEDVIATSARPLELPGGAKAFRHWSVSARSGHAQIELNLSVTSGAVNRSVLVRGIAALACCNYDLDVYTRSEPARYSPLINDFVNVQKQAKQQIVGSAKIFARSIVGTLAKRTYASPYAYTFEKSIGAFYRSIAGDVDNRMLPQIGRHTIEVCEAIVQSAGASANVSHSKLQQRKGKVLTKPTVLVLGGTGFIGRHLLVQLAKRKVGVRLVTRNLVSARILYDDQVDDIIEGDIGDSTFLQKALAGISTVFHLAKCDGSKWEDYVKGEVELTKTLGACCLKAGVKRLIYTGTIDSYYSARSGAIITGATPTDKHIAQRNFYARSKAMSEQILLQLYREQGLPVVIFRPGIVIGPGGPASHWGVGRFWNEASVDYWGNGLNKLPFVLVEDVVSALLKGMDKTGIEGNAFLLTDDPLMSGRDYVAALSSFLETQIRNRPKSVLRHYLGDVGKELLKHLIRHPNRRVSSYRDWSCKAHASRYDSTETCIALDWKPAGTKEALIERGIRPMAEDFLR